MNLKLLEHPLLRHHLGVLRDKNSSTEKFRDVTKEISRILAYEALRDWKDLEDVDIETPLAKTKVQRMHQAPLIISVMRAGNPMLDAILGIMPFASAGHIGIYRDKFIHTTVEYYFKIPKEHVGRAVFLCEPLIATADTSIAAIDRLKSYNVGKIRLLSILVSPQGVEKLAKYHPDVEIYALEKEQGLNELGYLMPGLGDAGDRLYGTK